MLATILIIILSLLTVTPVILSAFHLRTRSGFDDTMAFSVIVFIPTLLFECLIIQLKNPIFIALFIAITIEEVKLIVTDEALHNETFDNWYTASIKSGILIGALQAIFYFLAGMNILFIYLTIFVQPVLSLPTAHFLQKEHSPLGIPISIILHSVYLYSIITYNLAILIAILIPLSAISVYFYSTKLKK